VVAGHDACDELEEKKVMQGKGVLTHCAQHVELVCLADFIVASGDGLEEAVLGSRDCIAEE
jgi:hypothetical protein